MADAITIDAIREKYPQYNDMSDAQLADGLHQKFYSDMPFNQFASKIGYSYDAAAGEQAAASPVWTEYGADPAVSQTRGPQGQISADVNAVGQGLVGGVGSGIAGAGRAAQAGGIRGTKAQLDVMDAIDRGETVPQDRDVVGYQSFSPEQRAKAREQFTAASDELGKREPNVAIRTGEAIKSAATSAFPIAPENEGFQTGVGRLIGGAVPAIAAGAPGGPVGVLASLAVIGSQAYDATYHDAIANGATPEDAESAAGKSALAQAATMVAPIGRLLQVVPVPLREGLAATLVNLGQHGIELGGANALATFAQNYVASQTYDPTRPLTQGIAQAGLEGAVAGLIIHGTAIGVAGARAQRLNTGAPTPSVADIGAAPNVDAAIAAAADVVKAPVATEPAPTAFGDLFAQPAETGFAPVPLEFQSAGAAASRDTTHPGIADLSTADMKANRYQAEMSELLAPPEANDRRIYVNGSLPTLAEYSGDPLISQQENLVRQRNPGAFIGDGKRLTENNIARVKLYDDNTPSRTALDMMRDDRNAQWAADADKLLPNAKPADLTPAWDWVQGELSNPRVRENDAVVNVLEDFRDRLVDDDGNLKTDPAAVWGIHDHLRNRIETAKNPLNATGSEKYAQIELGAAKRVTDEVMNTSTDNQFQTALDNYAKASQAINAGELLDAFRPKLTNPAGTIMGDRFHNFVKGLATLRGNPGIDPAMSISDATMRAMINIANDLKRAGLIKLGAAAGSPTNLLGALAESMGVGAAHLAVGMVSPGLGNLALNAGLKLANGTLGTYRLNKLTEKHLAPPPEGYIHPEPEPLPAAGAGSASAPSPAASPPLPLFRQSPAPATPTPTAVPTPTPTVATPAAAPTPRLTPEAPKPVEDTTGLVAGLGGAGAAMGHNLRAMLWEKLQQGDTTELGRPSRVLIAAKEAMDRGEIKTPSDFDKFVQALAQPADPRASTAAGPKDSIAFTPSGAAVAVRYTVRDASTMIASQLADGRTNPAFPAALQPRDRTRAASIQQVNSIANRLEPQRLGASASTSEGAPIIGPDGVVESGNARTMAIMQAYADGGPRADAYRQWVASQGYDTRGMQHPVLVRERVGDLDMPARARLAADMGASPIAGMSAPERAAADARAIPTDILSMYQGGDVTLAKNAPFARAFAEHVVPPGEQAGFITADGEMSADGALRMRNALTQHAYGSNSLVTSLAENADPDIKAFGGALMDAAGHMAKLRGAIDSGKVSAASDIAPDIVAAAQLIQTARRQRISLADAVGQRDAFSTLPEQTEDILQAAFGDDYAGRMSRARMADLLSAYSENAQIQAGLFGANKAPSEILAEARARYGYGTKAGINNGSGIPVGNGPSLDLHGAQARGSADDTAGHGEASAPAAGSPRGTETPDGVTPRGIINRTR